MNWVAIAAGFAVLTFFTNICVGAFVYGKLTEKTANNATRLDEHDGLHREHATKLGSHDVKIGKLEQWKDGFNAGSRRMSREV